MPSTILKFSSPDRVGLLAQLTGFIADHGGNLLEVHQFTDRLNEWFFARLTIDSRTLKVSPEQLSEAFQPLGQSLSAEWAIRLPHQKQRVVILVSKADHCLTDLLGRWRSGELPVEIPLVIGNHETLRPLVEREGIPFACVPVPASEKVAAFEQLEGLCREACADLLVMARYMQILPPEMCDRWAGRVINIHHSFLPSFAGANPYRRAYERGVKLIGATCHYATGELDAGPIIDQEVVRVEHFHGPGDLLRLGRDCERLALARGVRYHVDDRVLVHNGRSIVFRD